MNTSPESSIFGLPITSSDCTLEVLKIEKTATKALKNINLIYNEIMTPKQYSPDELEASNLTESFEDLYSCSRQNHYLKTCCNTLKELCVKCDRYISRCSSCNQCSCRVPNANSRRVRNSENSDNRHPAHRPSSAPESSLSVRCTVPKPFALYAKNEERLKAKEDKISHLKLEIEKEIENELKIRPNFKPVPKNTHLPLYNKMVEEQERNKIKRKEICQEILKSTKPFNLHTSDNETKSKFLSDLTVENKSAFKAKPVPKHILSDKVSERLRNKEEIRKMLMVERAKETIEHSSSPFSQRPISYSRSLTNLLNLNKTLNKEESKPRNISEITKRLYMKKCNETIDSWNSKVLLVDNCKKITNQEKQNLLLNEHIHKKQLNKLEELPFMYFPVRMSNAAILRERLIRSEISARKEREKRKTQEDELARKKSDSDILNKLRDLIPSPEAKKEIDEKVKNFKESQFKRQLEYEKELEEIMQRVSEQKLLLERQSKIKEVGPRRSSNAESVIDYDNESSSEGSALQSDKNSSTASQSEEKSSVAAQSNEDC